MISPLFYIEVLADLEKAVRAGRSPDEEVGIIAQKTPEMHGYPANHHTKLAMANLAGNSVPMDGRIPIAGGKLVKVEDKSGVVYDEPPDRNSLQDLPGPSNPDIGD